jgi:hypothetical protein
MSRISERFAQITTDYSASELDAVFTPNYSYYMSFLDALHDDLLTRRAVNEIFKQQQKKAACARVAVLLAEAATLVREHGISLVIPEVTDAVS